MNLTETLVITGVPGTWVWNCLISL